MVETDPPRDDELRAAWTQFCDRLRDAGELVFKEANPATGRQRADGFRYLTQNLSQAFDLALETKDPHFPAIHAFCAPDRKLGGDNADFVYLQAWIDGYEASRADLGIDPSVDLHDAVLYTWAAELGLGVLEAIGITPRTKKGWADMAARFGRSLTLPATDHRASSTSRHSARHG